MRVSKTMPVCGTEERPDNALGLCSSRYAGFHHILGEKHGVIFHHFLEHLACLADLFLGA